MCTKMNYKPTTNENLGMINVQIDQAMAKESISHDEAKDYLLGKRGNPCRDNLENLVRVPFHIFKWYKTISKRRCILQPI